jgi:hypothetical protein
MSATTRPAPPQMPPILMLRSGSAAIIEPITRFELIPERTSDGRIVFRAAPRGPREWLRQLMRRFAPAH